MSNADDNNYACMDGIVHHRDQNYEDEVNKMPPCGATVSRESREASDTSEGRAKSTVHRKSLEAPVPGIYVVDTKLDTKIPVRATLDSNTGQVLGKLSNGCRVAVVKVAASDGNWRGLIESTPGMVHAKAP